MWSKFVKISFLLPANTWTDLTLVLVFNVQIKNHSNSKLLFLTIFFVGLWAVFLGCQRGFVYDVHSEADSLRQAQELSVRLKQKTTKTTIFHKKTQQKALIKKLKVPFISGHHQIDKKKKSEYTTWVQSTCCYSVPGWPALWWGRWRWLWSPDWLAAAGGRAAGDKTPMSCLNRWEHRPGRPDSEGDIEREWQQSRQVVVSRHVTALSNMTKIPYPNITNFISRNDVHQW